MLTSFSHLSVGERGSRVYGQIVAHDLCPAAISTSAYLSSFGSEFLTRKLNNVHFANSVMKISIPCINVFVGHTILQE